MNKRRARYCARGSRRGIEIELFQARVNATVYQNSCRLNRRIMKAKRKIMRKNCKVKQEKIEEFMTVTERSMVSNKGEHRDKQCKEKHREGSDSAGGTRVGSIRE